MGVSKEHKPKVGSSMTLSNFYATFLSNIQDPSLRYPKPYSLISFLVLSPHCHVEHIIFIVFLPVGLSGLPLNCKFYRQFAFENKRTLLKTFFDQFQINFSFPDTANSEFSWKLCWFQDPNTEPNQFFLYLHICINSRDGESNFIHKLINVNFVYREHLGTPAGRFMI